MRSETGRIRSTNQDSGYGDALMAVIADGVGGGPSGDIASATVVRTLVDQLDCRLGDPEQVRSVIAMANSELTSLMRHDPSLNGMATTLTALVPLGDQLGVVHIGDSRAYVFRGDQSAQVTRDDSLVRLMVENGQLSRDEAARSEERR